MAMKGIFQAQVQHHRAQYGDDHPQHRTPPVQPRNAMTERMAAAVRPSPPRNEMKIIALVRAGEANA